MNIIDIAWHQPVTVKLQNGTERRFTGTYDALDFLENEWPIRKGRHYDNAILFCRAAAMRSAAAEVAREAFIAACLEAGLSWTADHGHGPPAPQGGATHVVA
jgi:hypothetical protein